MFKFQCLTQKTTTKTLPTSPCIEHLLWVRINTLTSLFYLITTQFLCRRYDLCSHPQTAPPAFHPGVCLSRASSLCPAAGLGSALHSGCSMEGQTEDQSLQFCVPLKLQKPFLVWPLDQVKGCRSILEVITSGLGTRASVVKLLLPGNWESPLTP